MILLSKKKYNLKNVPTDFFWKELDNITAGQNINPEISYTPQYFANFENIFAGRKIGDTFSLYLYKPKTFVFRTEILAKGRVKDFGNDIEIDCRFEIPFGSFIKFIIISFLINAPMYLTSIGGGLVLSAIIITIYSAVIGSNHNGIRTELQNQINTIENKFKSSVA